MAPLPSVLSFAIHCCSSISFHSLVVASLKFNTFLYAVVPVHVFASVVVQVLVFLRCCIVLVRHESFVFFFRSFFLRIEVVFIIPDQRLHA